MENECIYISSRGIAKCCTFYPNKIVSDSSNNIEYLNDVLDKNRCFDGMTIYLVTNTIRFFVKNILPKIEHKFILVSGASTLTSPVESLNELEFNLLMSNKNLIKWCCQNNSIKDRPRILQIPLGLDYHTIYNNPNHKWKSANEGSLPIEQEKILLSIRENSRPFYERKRKIFVNFSLCTDRFGQRKECLKIPKRLLDICLDNMKRTKTWEISSKYAFILSPYGNGMDCHRTWEALVLGAIPIIKSKEFGKMFEDLPVLNVNNWSDINEKLLDDTIEKFKNKTFNYSKLTLEYWKEKISSIT
jgi:hypothetical protein